jgi:hypothetical protein
MRETNRQEEERPGELIHLCSEAIIEARSYCSGGPDVHHGVRNL